MTDQGSILDLYAKHTKYFFYVPTSLRRQDTHKSVKPPTKKKKIIKIITYKYLRNRSLVLSIGVSQVTGA